MANRSPDAGATSSHLKSRATSQIPLSQLDWGEHADSPIRKRPRLNSNSLTDEAVLGNHSCVSKPRSDSTSSDDLHATNTTQIPRHEQHEEQIPTSPRTPMTSSKVTLNIRSFRANSLPVSPSLGADPPSDQSARNHVPIDRSEHTPQLRQRSASPNTMDLTAESTISSPHSPPVVEIDIDDADDTSDDLYPTQIIDVNDAERELQLMDSFPYADEHGAATAAVMLVNALSGKEQMDIQWLVRISAWLEDWLRYARLSSTRCRRAYTVEYEFWCNVGLIYTRFLNRKTQFGNLGGRAGDGQRIRIIQRIFDPYIEWVGQLIHDDLKKLSRMCLEPKMSMDLISSKHLKNLELIFKSPQDVPLWRVLTHVYRINIEHIQRIWVSNNVNNHSQALIKIIEFVKMLAQHIDIWTKFNTLLDVSGLLLGNIMFSSRDVLRQSTSGDVPAPYKAMRSKLLEVVEVLEHQLNCDLDRQTAALSIDLSLAMARLATSILFEVATVEPTITQPLFIKEMEGTDDILSTDLPRILRDCLYFRLMWKFVAKGRMELRVQGVTLIAEMLIGLWRDYNMVIEPPANPVMQLFAKLLLQEKVVEYLISVDSHPQLIVRSRDILGFLFVTQRWTREMTNHFWSTVTILQDRRIAAAAMDVHASVLSLSQTPQLLDFVEKLYNLPISAFGPEVRQFMRTLLSDFNLDTSFSAELHSNPQYLCLHILQQTSGSATEGALPIDVAEVRNLAFEMLQKLSLKNSNAHEREQLYGLCLHEIQIRSNKALGSVDSIAALAAAHQSEDLQLLAVDMDLPQVLAREICAAIVRKRTSCSSFEQDVCSWMPLLKLFMMLVTHRPTFSLSPEVETKLWDHLIGDEAYDNQTRDDAWAHLCEVVAQISTDPNPLIDRLIQQYSPTISPHLFTLGMLQFIEASIYYVLRLHPHSPPSEHSTFSVPLSDLLWRIILVAPDNAISDNAITLLSRHHFQTHLTVSAPASSVAATQIDLVNRCVEQLEDATVSLTASESGQGHGGQTFEPSHELNHGTEAVDYLSNTKDALRFTRTLQFLQKFLSDVKSRPESREFPQQKTIPIPEPLAYETLGVLDEASITFKYQPFNAGRQGDIKQLRLPQAAKFSQLLAMLRELTGFNMVSIICGGKILDLSACPQQSASDLVDRGLLIVRNMDLVDTSLVRVFHDGSAAEKAISTHFDTFYRLLDLPESLSIGVFNFLNDLPPHSRVREVVLHSICPLSELLPSDRRIRTLYSLRSLQKCLVEQSNTEMVNEQFILHGVRLLTTAITDSRFHTAYLCFPVDAVVVSSLFQCLLAFLKERPVQNDMAPYLSSELTLVEHLYTLLLIAKGESSSLLAQESSLIYATIIEASFHSAVAWEAFINNDSNAEVHYWLMTSDSTRASRERVMICIESTFTSTIAAVAVHPRDYAAFYWRVFSALIPRSGQHPFQARQILAISVSVFAKYAAAIADHETLCTYMTSWTDLLSNYTHAETPGLIYVDDFVLGLSRLLSVCVSFMKAFPKSVSKDRLVNVLFSNFLFPPLAGEELNIYNPNCGPPILDDETRKALYNLCVSLCENVEDYTWLISKTAELLLREAQCDPIPWNTDRLRWLRTRLGYAGLKNLTNTCYMNSLVAQLFMNSSFRGFMLDVDLTGDCSTSSSHLIAETQNLFAHLQDGTLKYADTGGFAHAIQPYDSDHIDVTIQMDVDEFYNLLFDRWESQLPSQESKQKFRTFYGGQLVTQIKSMDCYHVSECEEPFLAIQCDVKGKTCLTDSLKSYVEGDVMEGDNKYKCEACGGRFVNAVKRSCLKNLPDNLIFHLKRFDFDLTTLQRSKINDEFCFPDQINMTPYQVHYLNNPEGSTESDIFELVGVLVHNGTAETGHYYSYIRLPKTSGGGPTWGEFNDAEVADFDPSKIPDQCFGGVWEQPGTDLQFPKTHNAYMLFYRRVLARNDLQPAALLNIAPGPIKVAVPEELKEDILSSNEILIRRYCLFGSAHAFFVRTLIMSMENMHEGIRSSNHALEHKILSMGLEYLNLVFARVKDTPDVDALALAIRRLCSTCGECCVWSLKWIAAKSEVTSAMLLQCPYPTIRTLWADLIAGNLRELRRHDVHLYGLYLSEEAKGNLPRSTTPGTFHQVVNMLLLLFPTIGKYLRSWDEYFSLWASIANLGVHELGILLCENLLRDCLELLLFDKEDRFFTQLQNERNVENLHFLSKTRRNVPLNGLVHLVYNFVLHVNPFLPTVNDMVERYPSVKTSMEKFPLTDEEKTAIVGVDKRTKQMPFISKIMEAMEQESNPQDWYPGLVISSLLGSNPPAHIVDRMAQSLAMSFGEWLPAFSGFLLRSAVYFCRCCHNLEEAMPVVNAAASNAQALNKRPELKRNVFGFVSDYASQGGKEHIAFFRQLVYLDKPICAMSSQDDHPFELPVIKASGIWAPPLLLFDERQTRESASALLDDLIFDHFPDDINETDPHPFDIARTEAVRVIFEKCRLNINMAEKCQVSRSVVRCTMVVLHRCAQWLALLRDDNDAAYLRRSEDEAMIFKYAELEKSVDLWRDEDGDGNFSETEWASQFDDDDESDELTEALG